MDIQTATVVIAGISVVIAAVNSIVSSQRSAKNERLTLETRQAELFMQIYNRWNSRDFSNAYLNFRYHKTVNDILDLTDIPTGGRMTREEHSDWQLLTAFFDGVGVLLDRGLLDISLVEDLFAGRIIAIWEKYSKVIDIDEARRIRKDPKMHDHFEYLYHAMKQHQQAPVNT